MVQLMKPKTMICAGGEEITVGSYCTVCGSKPGEKCHKKRNASRAAAVAARAKRIADRAEQVATQKSRKGA